MEVSSSTLRGYVVTRAAEVCKNSPYIIDTYQEDSWVSGCDDSVKGKTADAVIHCAD